MKFDSLLGTLRSRPLVSYFLATIAVVAVTALASYSLDIQLVPRGPSVLTTISSRTSMRVGSSTLETGRNFIAGVDNDLAEINTICGGDQFTKRDALDPAGRLATSLVSFEEDGITAFCLKEGQSRSIGGMEVRLTKVQVAMLTDEDGVQRPLQQLEISKKGARWWNIGLNALLTVVLAVALDRFVDLPWKARQPRTLSNLPPQLLPGSPSQSGQ